MDGAVGGVLVVAAVGTKPFLGGPHEDSLSPGRARRCHGQKPSGHPRAGRCALHGRTKVAAPRRSEPFSSCHRGHNTRQLLGALGQRRRPWLENDGTLHLVQLVIEDCPHGGPAWPSANLVGLGFSAAPACHHTLWVASRHLLGGENPALRTLAPAGLDAHVLAANQLQKLRTPADAGGERLMPLLEKHAGPSWEPAGAVGQTLEVPRELVGEPICLVGEAHQRADEAYRLQNVPEAAL